MWVLLNIQAFFHAFVRSSRSVDTFVSHFNNNKNWQKSFCIHANCTYFCRMARIIWTNMLNVTWLVPQHGFYWLICFFHWSHRFVKCQSVTDKTSKCNRSNRVGRGDLFCLTHTSISEKKVKKCGWDHFEIGSSISASILTFHSDLTFYYKELLGKERQPDVGKRGTIGWILAPDKQTIMK